MRFPGFIGPSYTLASVNYDCQRSLNLYPEINERGTGKEGEVASLVGTPGLSLLATVGTGPIRGAWFTTTGALYVVSGKTLYYISSAWVATSIGTLLTTSGQVGMSDNSLQLMIVDGQNGYYVTLSNPVATQTLVQINDPNWLGSNIITYQDGYFIFLQPGTKQFYLSDLNAITFTAPALTGKSGNPDLLVSIICNNRNLWLLGDKTIEVWFDAGANLNPFQYISGSMSQYGCAAQYSVAKSINNIFWLGKDPNGSGVVYTNNNYYPQRISTLAVEKAIQGYSVISDAIGFCYQENGHQFYVLTFPTANATWAYDSTSGMWHERGYLNKGVLERIRSNCYAFAYNTHVVGDYSNGNIYNQNINVYSDNGSAILRQRVSPHISKDMNRFFFQMFQLDMETGVGIDGTGQGTSPQAILEWSDDGGHTWSNQYFSTIGAIGATKNRAIWRRLGNSRNRVFRVSVTDPIKNVWIGAEIDLQEGAS